MNLNFVSSKYMGGLGNRLFQLATSYGYAKKYGKECVIAKNYYTENKQGKLHSNEYLLTIFSKIKQVDILNSFIQIVEPGFKNISYFELPNINHNNILLNGYFQCEKYFSRFRSELMDLLVLPDIPVYPDKNSIFLHVRRGDYTNNKLHGGINYDIYYTNALDYFKNHEKLNVYVFSDDLEWCKTFEVFRQFPQFHFNYYDLNELQTLKFMSVCDLGGIAANSSFSWWGGYLNQYKNKIIIFPNNWFFDEPHSKYVNEIAFEGSVKVECS